MKYTNGRTVIASLQIGEHPLLNIPTQVKPHSVDLSLKNVAAAQAASSSDFWKNVAATPNFWGEELWWRALSVWFIDNACFKQGNHDLWCHNKKNVYIGSFFGTRLLISWKICKFLKRWIDGGIVKKYMILENIDSIYSGDLIYNSQKISLCIIPKIKCKSYVDTSISVQIRLMTLWLQINSKIYSW